MKENNLMLQNTISAMVALVIILSTYLIVDIKSNDISQKVVSQMLAIEYDKVWWLDNYVKINKIQREQIIAWLKQYESQNWAVPTAAPQASNNVQVPAPAWSTLSIEDVKKITTEWTYILWNPDAEVTWIEYSDLECPFCKKMHNAWTIDEVIAYYNGKVNFIFKQFPLWFHANAQKESEAILCAWELGWKDKYYEYITTVFQRTRSNWTWFSLDALVPLAKELWLDESKFKTCLDSNKYYNQVQAEMAEWSGVFGITWTPWNVLINNKTGKWDKLPWAYPTASFITKIDSLLK